MTVGKKIRAIRKSLKQTQKQLAKASGIGLNSIIRYEKGLRDPTISQLHFIGLSDNVTYVVEDLEVDNVDRYSYTLNFNPKMWIPVKPGYVD